jgi:hypothetical protein
MPADDKFTVTLFHFDRSLTDETGRLWSNGGNITTSTSQSKFNGSSLFVNGVQYLSSNDDSLCRTFTSDFTIDFWMSLTAFNTNGIIPIFIGKIGGGPYTQILQASVSATSIGVSSGNGSAFQISASGTVSISTGVWYHIAFVRSGASFTCYLNGSSIFTATYAGTLAFYPNGNTAVYIGSSLAATGSQYGFGGYIDEFRISSIARWTANFTPPTLAYKPCGSAPTHSLSTYLSRPME